jgi:hypothetical protein
VNNLAAMRLETSNSFCLIAQKLSEPLPIFRNSKNVPLYLRYFDFYAVFFSSGDEKLLN